MSLPERVSSTQINTSHQPMTRSSVLLAILTVVFWGGTAVSNQFMLDVMPPLLVGGIRFGMAAAFMLAWCLRDRSPIKVPRQYWSLIWWMGVLLFLQIATFNIGSTRSSTSHASVLVNTYIFWVAIWEHFFSGSNRLVRHQWFGLFLAAIGCLWVFADTGHSRSLMDQPSIQGNLILALSGAVLAVKIVYTKYCVLRVNSNSLIFWHDVVGASLFFVFSPFVEQIVIKPMDTANWIALLYAGLIVSGFCFGANAILLRKHGASQVSVFSFGTPIVGVFLGFLMRGDALSSQLLIGGIFVVIGIYLVNRMPKKTPIPETDKPHSLQA